MRLSLTDEQDEIRDQARRFLEDHSGSRAVRALSETPGGYDPGVWRDLGGLGWLGIHVPEEFGGAGYGMVELAILFEEQGRRLFCAPFFSTACLAVNVLLAAASREQQQRYFPPIVRGETISTLAFSESGRRWDAAEIALTAKKSGEGWVLEGKKQFVLDGLTAGLIIVAARTGQASDPVEGVSLFAVEATASGLSRRAMTTLDPTRKQAVLSFEGVKLARDALLGEEGAAWPALARALDLASVALAAEQAGAAQACLDMAVEYAKQRVAFGKPIGMYQAIKHKCAQVLARVESARSTAVYASALAASGAKPAELALAASLAKTACCEAAFFAARENIMVHGGIGFTWEHDAHLYFRRAKSSELLFGDGAWHRERIAQGAGL